MRKFAIILLVILAILFTSIGFLFGRENSDPMVITLLGWSSVELPAFLWLITSLVLGFLLGYLVVVGKNLSLRMKLRQARAELKRRSSSANRIVSPASGSESGEETSVESTTSPK